MSGGAISTGTWTHLAQTWDGSTQKIYVNGDFVTSTSQGSPVFESFSRSNIIGARWDGTVGNIDGTIDEVRVYSEDLSAEQIKQLYHAYTTFESGV